MSCRRQNIHRRVSQPLQRIIIGTARGSAPGSVRAGPGRILASQCSHKGSDRGLNSSLGLHHRRIRFHTSIIVRGYDKTGRLRTRSGGTKDVLRLHHRPVRFHTSIIVRGSDKMAP